MTLEEAIKHLDESLADPGHDWGCEECKGEHEQLLEWLRELRKAKRLLGEALRTLNDGSCNKDCRQCKWNENGCEMSCRFAWKHDDEASALIGDENDAE